jgi:hypothetical protein
VEGPSALLALESRQLDHAPTARASEANEAKENVLASGGDVRKADDV